MSDITPNPKKRSYLLPTGCKDLHDVLQLPTQESDLRHSDWNRERISLFALSASDLLQTGLTQEQKSRIYAMLVHSVWLFLRCQRRSVSVSDLGLKAVGFAERLLDR